MSIPASEVSLRSSKVQAWYRAIVLLGLLPLAGCIAHAPGSGGGGGGSQPLIVTVAPTPSPVAVGSTQKFSAAITPSSTNQAVTWSLSLGANSSSPATDLGNIDSTGMYTAPTTVPDCAAGVQSCEIQVVVTATAVANTAFSGQTLANGHIVITISPLTRTVGGAPETVGQGANRQYTATVTGTTNVAVNWGAVCVGCASGQGGGAFDPNNLGLYIAPPFEQGVTTGQPVSITATSDFDPTQAATANTTVLQTDPLGMVSSSAQLNSCPGGGLSGGTCYQLNTSCDGVTDWSVYLKVNAPAGTPKGTVIFTTGSGGSALYDNDSPDFFYIDSTTGVSTNGGLAVVQGVLNAGFTTVQVSFGAPFNATNTENGWLQGPGGVRRLACRYATAAQWVYDNIHKANANAPYCATGNSGGSAAIAYAVTEYGLDSKFSMIEPTSGPVTTRLDEGCSPQGSNNYGGQTACSSPSLDMSYSPGVSGTAGIVDTAYQSVGATTPTLCTDGINQTGSSNTLRFQSDSIEYEPSKSPAIPIPDPPTVVNVLFGGQDGSNAVPQGETWWVGVGPRPTQACVIDAPHAIPASPSGAGAAQIVTDIQNLCKLH